MRRFTSEDLSFRAMLVRVEYSSLPSQAQPRPLAQQEPATPPGDLTSPAGGLTSEKHNKLACARFAFPFRKGPSAPSDLRPTPRPRSAPRAGAGVGSEEGSSTQPRGHGARIPRPELWELLGLRNRGAAPSREANRPGQLSSRPRSLHQLRQATKRGQAQLTDPHTEPPNTATRKPSGPANPPPSLCFPGFVLGCHLLS